MMNLIDSIIALLDAATVVSFVNLAGSAASVVALIQVGRIWSRMQQMERGYVQQQRLPAYGDRLRAVVKNLRNARSQQRRQSAQEELARCESSLSYIQRLVDTPCRKRVRRLACTIANVRKTTYTDGDYFASLDEIIAETSGIAQNIDHFVTEQPWRHTNAK